MRSANGLTLGSLDPLNSAAMTHGAASSLPLPQFRDAKEAFANFKSATEAQMRLWTQYDKIPARTFLSACGQFISDLLALPQDEDRASKLNFFILAAVRRLSETWHGYDALRSTSFKNRDYFLAYLLKDQAKDSGSVEFIQSMTAPEGSIVDALGQLSANAGKPDELYEPVFSLFSTQPDLISVRSPLARIFSLSDQQKIARALADVINGDLTEPSSKTTQLLQNMHVVFGDGFIKSVAGCYSETAFRFDLPSKPAAPESAVNESAASQNTKKISPLSTPFSKMVRLENTGLFQGQLAQQFAEKAMVFLHNEREKMPSADRVFAFQYFFQSAVVADALRPPLGPTQDSVFEKLLSEHEKFGYLLDLFTVALDPDLAVGLAEELKSSFPNLNNEIALAFTHATEAVVEVNQRYQTHAVAGCAAMMQGMAPSKTFTTLLSGAAAVPKKGEAKATESQAATDDSSYQIIRKHVELFSPRGSFRNVTMSQLVDHWRRSSALLQEDGSSKSSFSGILDRMSGITDYKLFSELKKEVEKKINDTAPTASSSPANGQTKNSIPFIHCALVILLDGYLKHPPLAVSDADVTSAFATGTGSVLSDAGDVVKKLKEVLSHVEENQTYFRTKKTERHSTLRPFYDYSGAETEAGQWHATMSQDFADVMRSPELLAKFSLDPWISRLESAQMTRSKHIGKMARFFNSGRQSDIVKHTKEILTLLKHARDLQLKLLKNVGNAVDKGGSAETPPADQPQKTSNPFEVAATRDAAVAKLALRSLKDSQGVHALQAATRTGALSALDRAMHLGTMSLTDAQLLSHALTGRELSMAAASAGWMDVEMVDPARSICTTLLGPVDRDYLVSCGLIDENGMVNRAALIAEWRDAFTLLGWIDSESKPNAIFKHFNVDISNANNTDELLQVLRDAGLVEGRDDRSRFRFRPTSEMILRQVFPKLDWNSSSSFHSDSITPPLNDISAAVARGLLKIISDSPQICAFNLDLSPESVLYFLMCDGIVNSTGSAPLFEHHEQDLLAQAQGLGMADADGRVLGVWAPEIDADQRKEAMAELDRVQKERLDAAFEMGLHDYSRWDPALSDYDPLKKHLIAIAILKDTGECLVPDTDPRYQLLSDLKLLTGTPPAFIAKPQAGHVNVRALTKGPWADAMTHAVHVVFSQHARHMSSDSSLRLAREVATDMVNTHAAFQRGTRMQKQEARHQLDCSVALMTRNAAAFTAEDFQKAALNIAGMGRVFAAVLTAHSKPEEIAPFLTLLSKQKPQHITVTADNYDDWKTLSKALETLEVIPDIPDICDYKKELFVRLHQYELEMTIESEKKDAHPIQTPGNHKERWTAMADTFDTTLKAASAAATAFAAAGLAGDSYMTSQHTKLSEAVHAVASIRTLPRDLASCSLEQLQDLETKNVVQIQLALGPIETRRYSAVESVFMGILVKSGLNLSHLSPNEARLLNSLLAELDSDIQRLWLQSRINPHAETAEFQIRCHDLFSSKKAIFRTFGIALPEITLPAAADAAVDTIAQDLMAAVCRPGYAYWVVASPGAAILDMCVQAERAFLHSLTESDPKACSFERFESLVNQFDNAMVGFNALLTLDLTPEARQAMLAACKAIQTAWLRYARAVQTEFYRHPITASSGETETRPSEETDSGPSAADSGISRLDSDYFTKTLRVDIRGDRLSTCKEFIDGNVTLANDYALGTKALALELEKRGESATPQQRAALIQGHLESVSEAGLMGLPPDIAIDSKEKDPIIVEQNGVRYVKLASAADASTSKAPAGTWVGSDGSRIEILSEAQGARLTNSAGTALRIVLASDSRKFYFTETVGNVEDETDAATTPVSTPKEPPAYEVRFNPQSQTLQKWEKGDDVATRLIETEAYDRATKQWVRRDSEGRLLSSQPAPYLVPLPALVMSQRDATAADLVPALGAAQTRAVAELIANANAAAAHGDSTTTLDREALMAVARYGYQPQPTSEPGPSLSTLLARAFTLPEGAEGQRLDVVAANWELRGLLRSSVMPDFVSEVTDPSARKKLQAAKTALEARLKEAVSSRAIQAQLLAIEKQLVTKEMASSEGLAALMAATSKAENDVEAAAAAVKKQLAEQKDQLRALEKAEAESKRLNGEQETQSKTVSDCDREISNLRAAIQRLEADIEQTRLAISNKTNEIGLLAVQKQAAESEAKTAQEAFTACGSALDALQQQLKTKESDFEKAEAESKASLPPESEDGEPEPLPVVLGQPSAPVSAPVSSLPPAGELAKLQQMRDEMDALKTQIADKIKEKSELESKKQEKEGALGDAQSKLTDAQRDLDVLETELKSKIAEKKGVEPELKKVISQEMTAQQALTHLDALIAAQTKIIEETQTAMKASARHLTETRAALHTAEFELERARAKEAGARDLFVAQTRREQHDLRFAAVVAELRKDDAHKSEVDLSAFEAASFELPERCAFALERLEELQSLHEAAFGNEHPSILQRISDVQIHHYHLQLGRLRDLITRYNKMHRPDMAAKALIRMANLLARMIRDVVEIPETLVVPPIPIVGATSEAIVAAHALLLRNQEVFQFIENKLAEASIVREQKACSDASAPAYAEAQKELEKNRTFMMAEEIVRDVENIALGSVSADRRPSPEPTPLETARSDRTASSDSRPVSVGRVGVEFESGDDLTKEGLEPEDVSIYSDASTGSPPESPSESEDAFPVHTVPQVAAGES